MAELNMIEKVLKKDMDRKGFLANIGKGGLAAVAVSAAHTQLSNAQVAEAATPDPGGRLNLRDYGAVGNGSTDDGPALQGALDALGSQGGGELVIPPGRFVITTTVFKDFNNLAASVRIVGYGSASQLLIKAGATATAITIGNLQHLTIQGVTFAGTPGVRNDAGIVLALGYCESATLRDCSFYGLSSFDNSIAAIIHAGNSNLSLERCAFRGTTAGGAVVINNGWNGFRAEDCLFIDHGVLNGTSVSKTPSGGGVWIQALTPARYPLDNVLAHGVFTVRNTDMDEGTVRAVQVDPASGRVARVHLDGINVNTHVNGIAIDINKADLVVIENSYMGYASTGDVGDAVKLRNVKEALISRSFCMQLSNRITADAACGALTVAETSYVTLDSAAATTKVIKDGKGGVVPKLKAGAVTDSDFEAAPPDGTVAVDTANSRLYVRIGGAWTYTALTTSAAPPDTTSPGAPTGLAASAQSASQIDLTWTAAPDNVAVTGYDIYRNGTKVSTVTGAGYSDTGLAASTAYSYYVVAKDAAGNASPASNTAGATTQAAVSANGTPHISSFTPPNLRNDFGGWVGYKFTVGSTPLQVSALARWVVIGNNGSHRVKLVNAGSGADVAGGSVTVATAGAPAARFRYADLNRPVPLAANTAYYLVSEEVAGGDTWYDYNTRLVTTAAAQSNGTVYAFGGSGWIVSGNPDMGYVPLNFLYA